LKYEKELNKNEKSVKINKSPVLTKELESRCS
jgi:hypothetical protein